MTSRGRLPDFLVAGAMRSGTTSLYRYLGAHPEVFLVPKELQFFTDGYSRGLDWYAAQFGAAGSRQVLGEATADYFARKSAMLRIADVLPSAQLIVSLRNPVDRAWSHYWLLRARGRESRPFATAVAEEVAAISTEGDETANALYLSHSLYDAHLDRAYRLFRPSQLHVSVFERMITDPVAMYRSMCTFLGVDPTYVPSNLGTPVNPFVTFRSLRIRRFAQRVPGPGGRMIARLNTRRDVNRPELEPSLRASLEQFFAPRIAHVERMLGRDLPEWRRAAD